MYKIKNNQLVSDSLWSLFGNVIGKGLALLAGIFVARFLGKNVFGEYGIIRNTILTIGVFSTFGLGYTATKYVAEYKRTSSLKLKVFIKIAINITLLFSGIMALLLFVFADYISVNFLDIEHLGTPLRILSILIIFNAITTTQIGILAGFGEFRKLAQINSLVGVLTFLSSIVLTYYWGLNGALLSLLSVQIINCFFNYRIVKKQIPTGIFNAKANLALYKEIIKFSTPIALQEFIYSLSTWISSILLIKFTTYGELGLYSAAMQWNAIVLFIPGILRNVILSHLSSNIEDKEMHNIILKKTIYINLISTLIPCFIIASFSNFIAKSYGITFQGLSSLISIAVFSTVFSSVSNVYAQAYTSLSKNWLMLFLRTFRDLMIIICFIFLIKFSKFSGAMSLVVSNILFGCFFLLIIIFYYNKFKKK